MRTTPIITIDGRRLRGRQVPLTIDTIRGRAYYKGTEIEDEEGNWNDSYSTNQGYYVIHKGTKHHVYKV